MNNPELPSKNEMEKGYCDCHYKGPWIDMPGDVPKIKPNYKCQIIACPNCGRIRLVGESFESSR